MTHALIVVDMQHDFMPGGPLGVPGANEIVPDVRALVDDFELVIATQDWHPKDHGSFASQHPGKTGLIELDGLSQIIWPDHCVQQTHGASFVPECGLDRAVVFQKGQTPTVDSYSGFFDNAKRRDTGLHAFLQSKGVTKLSVCGVATDYCVRFTVEDACALGYEVRLCRWATRGVELQPGDIQNAIESMRERGAIIADNGRPS